jgi:ribosome-associated translation inhibitor RaiA
MKEYKANLAKLKAKEASCKLEYETNYYEKKFRDQVSAYHTRGETMPTALKAYEEAKKQLKFYEGLPDRINDLIINVRVEGNDMYKELDKSIDALVKDIGKMGIKIDKEEAKRSLKTALEADVYTVRYNPKNKDFLGVIDRIALAIYQFVGDVCKSMFSETTKHNAQMIEGQKADLTEKVNNWVGKVNQQQSDKGNSR